MRILIAEDNPINRQLMLKHLGVVGDCEVAEDGVIAVELFDQALEQGQRYDLVCMDVMMPNMDGHEAVAQIRRLEQEKGIAEANQAKVIMTTAVDSASSFQIAETCGANGYLIKPVRKLQLYDELEKLSLVTPDFITEQLAPYRADSSV
jgi:two-component system chemotaxis response regulator CheY